MASDQQENAPSKIAAATAEARFAADFHDSPPYELADMREMYFDGYVQTATDDITFWRSLPVEQRMEAMGMVHVGWYGAQGDGSWPTFTEAHNA